MTSAHGEIRITMYFGNRKAAGPYHMSVPARGTLERADHHAADALAEPGESLEPAVVRIRR